MWPFRKRKQYPARSELVIGDSWAVGQGVDDEDRMLVVRFNRDLDRLIGHPEFGYQVGIAAPLTDPAPDGLPGSNEQEDLRRIEDELSRVLQAGTISIVAGVITTQGMREFVLYTTDPRQVVDTFPELQRRIETHELQLMIQPDPDWSVYREFRP